MIIPYEVPEDDRLSAYESLIRRLIQVEVPVVQAILAIKRDVEPGRRLALPDALHKSIGEAYGLPQADAVAWVRQAVYGRSTGHGG